MEPIATPHRYAAAAILNKEARGINYIAILSRRLTHGLARALRCQQTTVEHQNEDKPMARSIIIAPDRPPPLIKRKFRMPFDSAQVAWDWKTRGFSCAVFNDPPGRAWNGFLHDSDQLVTVFAGRLEIEIEGKRLILEQGDEAFIPCGARHSVRNISEQTTRWFYGYGDIAGAETVPQISDTDKSGHEFRY